MKLILLIHQNNKVLEIRDYPSDIKVPMNDEVGLIGQLFNMAISYPDHFLGWCEERLFPFFSYNKFRSIFLHKRIMSSFEIHDYYIPDTIGYIEHSPLININKNVPYPTWRMSSCVGGIHASLISQLKKAQYKDHSFELFLNVMAKQNMKNGLLCYSTPGLLEGFIENSYKQSPRVKDELFHFVRSNYKKRWLFILFLNFLIYEGKLKLYSLIKSLFTKEVRVKLTLDEFEINSAKEDSAEASIDVIIPTLGRKNFLYDVLKDLSNQSLLPHRVIIVEQNANLYSESELDFLTEEEWPFTVVHHFIHQTGACNARNLALQEVSSEYVYLADDDNRFSADLLEKAIIEMNKLGTKVLNMSYLQKGEVETARTWLQWHTFGAGCSIIRSELLKEVTFDMAFEHGYGEDADFGMQLRNIGKDVIYSPNLHVLHLKAPIGGFRKVNVMPWDKDLIIPKPSPTIMLYKLKHQSIIQIKGYKLLLFLRLLFKQKRLHFLKFKRQFNQQWNSSVRWAKYLKSEHE
ncbi:glycosyltransferase family 2 protein [Winogradskyella aurantiaca]|uniref:glycosyltransferase family 2 protein n=1 Tax=Winogradskyella aurantiaca TaxID=2219558 RepID=UPI000E1CD7A1|nr:glycosyltransferase family A protein [Winogradskyella aurantiaca]